MHPMLQGVGLVTYYHASSEWAITWRRNYFLHKNWPTYYICFSHYYIYFQHKLCYLSYI